MKAGAFCTETAKVYREAARQIAAGLHDEKSGRTQGACDVLGHPIMMNKPAMVPAFREWFVENEGYYLMDDVCASTAETKNVRILALCMMATLVEAGDA